MLLKVDIDSRLMTRVAGIRLNTFGLNERDLQDILFHSLDRLLPDDELLLIMQSRNWQEEPDLMALDKEGRLYIFELKAWESRSENLLQVLRYGQIYGSHSYDDLERLYAKFEGSNKTLKEVHKARFNIELPPGSFNSSQVFIVMTNGLDYRTREAVKYWRGCNLDVRPWVYRVYNGSDNEMLLEMSPFAVEDNPYEDIIEGYYILNTNFRNDPVDHQDMINNFKAAAYYAPWKYKIERLSKGDVVFLYQSGVGIVAFGSASGNLKKLPYQDDTQQPDEEYSMRLNNFQVLGSPVTASEIKEITGVNYRFMSTMFGVDVDGGRKLQVYCSSKNKNVS